MRKDGKEAASFWQPVHCWHAGPVGQEAGKYGFWTIVLFFSLVTILFQLTSHLFNYTDYIGPDPDDSMRLVEVRDFLGGQSWFDLRQYRLGLDGGTLMHWSRLIDLPIAALIAFFSLFFAPQTAEAIGAAVWPLLLVVPLFAATALAGFRVGGRQAMLMTLGLAVLYLLAIVRFRPGALDHHNVQLILATFIAAMLIDPLARISNYVAAAIACAVALAIGAETTPLVAVAAITVALLWAWFGERYRRAAAGFGFGFGIACTALFFGTTPPYLYSMVTCDTLSLGFFSLSAAGGFGLGAAALLLRGQPMPFRLASLVAVGALVAVLAVLVAPQCLGNPLDNLDPLLKTMWLNSIGEAQPITSEMVNSPEAAGGFYAVGLIALGVCAARILRRQQTVAYAILAALIFISWLVTLFQVRGMLFANHLAFIPLGALISELRALYTAQQKNPRAAVAFIVSVLASIPSVWTLTGMLALDAGEAIAGTSEINAEENAATGACVTQSSVKALAALPKGRILSTSNPGSVLLRFTPHSVLNANYHRNQSGMIEALKIGMAHPANAIQMMHRDHVTYVLLCTDDAQVDTVSKKAPNGFFARLAAGDVPEFLEPVDHGGEARLKIFKVL